MTLFSSITWRLTRLFALWLVAALLLSGALVYLDMGHATRRSAWRELDAQVAAVRAKLASSGGNTQGDAMSPTDADLLPSGAGFLYQVTDPHGAVLNRSSAGVALPWSVTPTQRIGLTGTDPRWAYVSEVVRLPGTPALLGQPARRSALAMAAPVSRPTTCRMCSSGSSAPTVRACVRAAPASVWPSPGRSCSATPAPSAWRALSVAARRPL